MSELLFQTFDPWGELSVLDDGTRRTLAFGPGDEQSVCLKADPALLQLPYTQAMLLGLLFAQPRKVLCLGLGAGSLPNALLRHAKGVKITAVELRQAVIDACQRYFYLPQSRRLRLICEDAGTFVASHREQYNLIFCDLYTAAGSAAVQAEPAFIQACAARLQADGVLVINCWNSDGVVEQVEQLVEILPQVRFCAGGPGNWVLLAGRTGLDRSARGLQDEARGWSQKLGFHLQKYVQLLN